uniref:Uncharacterized protein n=1 Tax=Lotharella globosa TaxID=91324 RepID=A0A6V3KM79_9EUKA
MGDEKVHHTDKKRAARAATPASPSKPVRGAASRKRPECCPSHLLRFRNQIINQTFSPHLVSRGVDSSCKHSFTDYARACMPNVKVLLEAMEHDKPYLPSLIFGPEKGFCGALYVGAMEAACNMEFLDKHRIVRIVSCTADARITEEHLRAWDEVGVSFKSIELDVKQMQQAKSGRESKQASGFGLFSCFGVGGGDFVTRQLQTIVSKIHSGLKRGGVLLAAGNGWAHAPALAALYIALVLDSSLDRAFAKVKEGRRFAEKVPPTMKIFERVLPNLWVKGGKERMHLQEWKRSPHTHTHTHTHTREHSLLSSTRVTRKDPHHTTQHLVDIIAKSAKSPPPPSDEPCQTINEQ